MQRRLRECEWSSFCIVRRDAGWVMGWWCRFFWCVLFCFLEEYATYPEMRLWKWICQVLNKATLPLKVCFGNEHMQRTPFHSDIEFVPKLLQQFWKELWPSSLLHNRNKWYILVHNKFCSNPYPLHDSCNTNIPSKVTKYIRQNQPG